MNLCEHLLFRNYDPSRYVNQVLDTGENILTVYLTNLSGQFVGFQQYRPDEEDKHFVKSKEDWMGEFHDH